MLPAPRINDVLHRVTFAAVGNPQGVKFSGGWYKRCCSRLEVRAVRYPQCGTVDAQNRRDDQVGEIKATRRRS